MKMKNQATGLYQAPKVDLVEVCTEGVLCESPKELEDLFEHPGHWGN